MVNRILLRVASMIKINILLILSTPSTSSMGKCSTQCLHPKVPFEASHHHCCNCSKKFHALLLGIPELMAKAQDWRMTSSFDPPVMVHCQKTSNKLRIQSLLALSLMVQLIV
jgi:hypothetical protein